MLLLLLLLVVTRVVGFFAFVCGLIGCFCKLHTGSRDYCIDILTGNVISMSKNISEEGAGETLGTEGRGRRWQSLFCKFGL